MWLVENWWGFVDNVAVAIRIVVVVETAKGFGGIAAAGLLVQLPFALA